MANLLRNKLKWKISPWNGQVKLSLANSVQIEFSYLRFPEADAKHFQTYTFDYVRASEFLECMEQAERSKGYHPYLRAFIDAELDGEDYSIFLAAIVVISPNLPSVSPIWNKSPDFVFSPRQNSQGLPVYIRSLKSPPLTLRTRPLLSHLASSMGLMTSAVRRFETDWIVFPGFLHLNVVST
jgi:hypothetical protein